jgi:hypothetical protein
LARKPLDRTVVDTVLRYRTGALNIDACRIGTSGARNNGRRDQSVYDAGTQIFGDFGTVTRVDYGKGRWPANVILDEEAAALLDEEVGERSPGRFPGPLPRRDALFGGGIHRGSTGPNGGALTLDKGGPSRFFYCPKASKKDRGEGNDHETVKPLKLMQWLVKLVSPPSCTILDPFAGSGSTLLAAMSEGQRAIGIDQDAHYCDIAVSRIERAERDARDARGDETPEESCDTKGVLALQGLLRHHRAASPAVRPGLSGPPLVSPLARWKGRPSAVRPPEAVSPWHTSPCHPVRAPPPRSRRGASPDESGSREMVLCRSLTVVELRMATPSCGPSWSDSSRRTRSHASTRFQSAVQLIRNLPV